MTWINKQLRKPIGAAFTITLLSGAGGIIIVLVGAIYQSTLQKITDVQAQVSQQQIETQDINTRLSRIEGKLDAVLNNQKYAK